jgi:hypothetical protein
MIKIARQGSADGQPAMMKEMENTDETKRARISSPVIAEEAIRQRQPFKATRVKMALRSC